MTSSSSVFLNVTDLEKSLEWYRGLGFKVVKTWKDDAGKAAWADLAYDGADLGLGAISSNDDPAYRQWVSTPLGAGVIVYFTVPDVDKVHAAAQKLRATIEFPLTDRPYGRTFTLNDPDGYTVSFITEGKKATGKKATGKKATGKKATGKKATGKKATGKKAKGKKAGARPKATKKARPKRK